jgi:ferric-dicitrate binding protein FerR (iron transport regulator)
VTRLDELLLKFQDGSAAPEELRELSALLETRDARASLVEEFLMTSAIRGQLRAVPERKTAPQGMGPRRLARTRRSLTPGPSRTWAWAAAALLAALFVMLLSSSPREILKTTAKTPAPALPAPPKEPDADVRPAPEPPHREEARPVEPLRPPTPPPEPPRPGPVPREEPKPAPPPEAPPAPKPAPEPPRPPRSQVTGIARIEKAEGTAFVVAKDGKSPALAGTEFIAGQGLETGGSGSRVVLSFPDKTQVELGPDSELSDVKVDAGTRLVVAAGTIRADVAPQPKNKPLIVATPHAEAKVLGTTLRVAVDRDPKKGTLLEVEKGRVELRRQSDRKTVIVGSGQFAVAAVGVDLKAKPLSPNVPMLRFTFEDGKTSPEWTGTVAAGPPRPGNSGCLEGRYLPDDRLTRVVLSDDANGLFCHREGAVLTFDYYADGETQILSIYVWNRTQSLSMGRFEIRNLVRRQWTRATVPLSELRDGEKHLQEGDLIKNLTIQTNTGNGILFVDNVEIAVPRSK